MFAELCPYCQGSMKNHMTYCPKNKDTAQMIQICAECGEKTNCPKCNERPPRISLVTELCKANSAYGKLSEKYEIARNFIRKIVHDWECDPNHADAILDELERIGK